jgi:outer membrane cobalamin receptor
MTLWKQGASAVPVLARLRIIFGSGGIGIGGVLPIGTALVTEFAPRRIRGTGFHGPTLTELYVNNPSFMVVGNPNLLPETSVGYDVGFEQPLLHDRLRFGATYFHNDITNLIEGTTNPTTFVSTCVNVGQATTYGFESFAALALTNGLNLRADYTYTEARDDLTGQELLRRPKNKASLMVTVEGDQSSDGHCDRALRRTLAGLQPTWNGGTHGSGLYSGQSRRELCRHRQGQRICPHQQPPQPAI